MFSSGQIQCAQYAPPGGYRTDCSGFVSYAWQIKDSNGQPNSPAAFELGKTYSTRLSSFAELKPGDIINNNVDGNDGHVVIFVNWTDPGFTRFLAYDENGDPCTNSLTGCAAQRELTIGKGSTLFEGPVGGLIQLEAAAPFYAERYVKSIGLP